MLFICEHGYAPGEINLCIPVNYTLVSCYCRKLSKLRGGSSIYTEKRIHFETVDIAGYCVDLLCDASAIKLSDCILAVINVYQTPDTDKDFLKCLKNLLDFI